MRLLCLELSNPRINSGMKSLIRYRSVVVMKELLSIYQPVYIPTLCYDLRLRVLIQKARSGIQAVEIRFLRQLSGHSLRDGVRQLGHSRGAQNRAADPLN